MAENGTNGVYHTTPASASAGHGGDGWQDGNQFTIKGDDAYYAGGGKGGSNNAVGGVNNGEGTGANNTGGGGPMGHLGNPGYSGIVMIRYAYG
jgi:hypothetical protein